MIEFLKKLFSKENAPSTSETDGLDQAQREAIIDLLLIATYSDDYVDVNETRILDKTIERFNWNSDTPIDDYVQSVEARVKEARSSQSSTSELLGDISDRLRTQEGRYRALNLCNVLLYSDTDLLSAEVDFLRKASKVFGLKR